MKASLETKGLSFKPKIRGLPRDWEPVPSEKQKQSRCRGRRTNLRRSHRDFLYRGGSQMRADDALGGIRIHERTVQANRGARPVATRGGPSHGNLHAGGNGPRIMQGGKTPPQVAPADQVRIAPESRPTGTKRGKHSSGLLRERGTQTAAIGTQVAFDENKKSEQNKETKAGSEAANCVTVVAADDVFWKRIAKTVKQRTIVLKRFVMIWCARKSVINGQYRITINGEIKCKNCPRRGGHIPVLTLACTPRWVSTFISTRCFRKLWRFRPRVRTARRSKVG